MANYVKFRRGRPEAFQVILNAGQTEPDTLYFIYEEDEATSELYLGSKLIASGGDVNGATTLAALQDVLLNSNLNETDCLIYDINIKKWVNKPIVDILPIFVGTNGESTAVAGLVPAPVVNNPNLFLRSDGKWSEIVTIEDVKLEIAKLDHLKRSIVPGIESIDTTKPEAEQYIYMVPSLTTDGYDEYMVINGELEKVGDWSVNLEEYAKITDVNTALANKVDVDENARLITFNEIEKLNKISENAEENFINNVTEEFKVEEKQLSLVKVAKEKVDGLVDTLNQISIALESKVNSEDNARLITNEEISKLNSVKDLIKNVDLEKFTIDQDGKLLLNSISIDHINGLALELAKKVEKVEGSRLITQEEAEKISKLSLDDNGNVGISGTVSAANVQELYNTIINIVTGNGTDLYDGVQKPLLNIEANAERNFINEVNETQLIVENRKLSIQAIDMNVVTGLTAALNNKASTSAVTDVERLLNSKVADYDARIAALEGQLIWQPLISE